MKRALVLSGGGSRGAYECGAWMALSELNIRLGAVYGTSIGAINAALVAQGDLKTAVDIWKNITMDRIAARDDGEEINIEHMLSRKRDLLPFLVGNAKNLRLDITPLKTLLDEKIDERRIRASGMDLGMMLTDVNRLSACPVRIGDIPNGQLTAYILASAACFPVFPSQKIDGKRYIDGGFVDNLPIGMALEDGAEEIIAVDIHPQPVHPGYEVMPFMRLIHPMRDLGNFLDFNRETLDRAQRMGYYDTMKSYGVLDGIRYTYKRFNELDVSEAARRYLNAAALFDAHTNEKKEDAKLITALTAETPNTRLSWKDSLLRGLELCAEILELRDDAIYSMEDQTHLALEYVRGVDTSQLKLHDRDKKDSCLFMAYIFQNMRNDSDFLLNNVKQLADSPREVAAALYLLTMEGKKAAY